LLAQALDTWVFSFVIQSVVGEGRITLDTFPNTAHLNFSNYGSFIVKFSNFQQENVPVEFENHRKYMTSICLQIFDDVLEQTYGSPNTRLNLDDISVRSLCRSVNALRNAYAHTPGTPNCDEVNNPLLKEPSSIPAIGWHLNISKLSGSLDAGKFGGWPQLLKLFAYAHHLVCMDEHDDNDRCSRLPAAQILNGNDLVNLVFVPPPSSRNTTSQAQ
jgi:hypothetical protein